MNSTEARPAWLPLATSSEIDDLMRLFGHFHDGCIREIHVATGQYVDQDLSMAVDRRTGVRMLVQRQFRNPAAIELRFDAVVGMRFSTPPPGYVDIIFGAAFFVRDGIYYWAGSADWLPDRPADDETTWIAARQVCWREASDWLGPELRYLATRD